MTLKPGDTPETLKRAKKPEKGKKGQKPAIFDIWQIA
jgi:hypothetical protein